MGTEPSQGLLDEKGGSALLLLVGHDGGEGQAGCVVDGDMQVFPAGAALAALAVAVAGDAMADTVDAAELLDVEVDQLARVLALVADDSGLGSSALSRPRPRRRRTSPTVETARPSRRAMAGLERRWRRNASI